jgi:hypothetical protein
MTWDLCKDLELAYEEVIGTGAGYYNGWLEYKIHPDDWVNGEVFLSVADFPDAETYVEFTPLGDYRVYMDMPLTLSAVTGITQYTGAMSDFTGLTKPPGYYHRKLAAEPVSARDWTVTDGTQVIYFSADYSGNTVTDTGYIVYVGYGDDDDGSTMSEEPDLGNDGAYDINFKAVTTGSVILSAHPISVMSMAADDAMYYTITFTATLVTTGEVAVKYNYRPLYQDMKIVDRYAVDFDGTDERLQQDPTIAGVALGIEDSWTILVWVRPGTNNSNQQNVFCHGNDSNPNRIHLYRNTIDADNPWVIDITDASANQKTYYFGPDLPMGYWYLIGARYSNATGLEVFVDGVEVTPSDSTQDDAMNAMADSNRYMAVGGKAMVVNHDGFDGRIYAAMSWSTVLADAEILYVYENPYNYWLADQSDYVSSAALEHWYRCGKNLSPEIGRDYGLTPIDLDEFGVDDTNIYEDFPTP